MPATESGLPPSELDDAQIAEATSRAAMRIVLQRTESKKDDRLDDFVTDAYATVGVAYHRAAGVYTMDKEMQELGTAAVHLLTIATSYTDAQKQEGPVR
jgi:preprotein translocase subunit SecA